MVTLSLREIEEMTVQRFSASAIRAINQTIVDEFTDVQGAAADIGGYYVPDPDKAASVMRPSATFNSALATLR